MVKICIAKKAVQVQLGVQRAWGHRRFLMRHFRSTNIVVNWYSDDGIAF